MAFKLAITRHCTYTQANKMATPMGYLHSCIHNPVIHNGQGIYQYINDKTHVIHNKLPFSLYKWKKSDTVTPRKDRGATMMGREAIQDATYTGTQEQAT